MADERDVERTTVVHTDGGRRGGGGLIAIAIVLLLALALLYMFKDEIMGAASQPEKVEIDVTTDAGGGSGS